MCHETMLHYYVSFYYGDRTVCQQSLSNNIMKIEHLIKTLTLIFSGTSKWRLEHYNPKTTKMCEQKGISLDTRPGNNYVMTKLI